MLISKRLIGGVSLFLMSLLAGCSDVLVPGTGLTCEDGFVRCDDDNPCTFDDCDESTGACLYENADGRACEIQGAPATCSGGSCGGSDKAIEFCQGYEEVCGFGGAGRYAGESDCRSQYDAGSTDKQECIEEHLGYATSRMDPQTHCPHAAGETICDL
jgi:hypothetical protein